MIQIHTSTIIAACIAFWVGYIVNEVTVFDERGPKNLTDFLLMTIIGVMGALTLLSIPIIANFILK